MNIITQLPTPPPHIKWVQMEGGYQIADIWDQRPNVLELRPDGVIPVSLMYLTPEATPVQTPAPVEPIVRSYTTNERVGRPRRLADDLNELTPAQRQRRIWNTNNKEKIQQYNKQRREKKKLEKAAVARSARDPKGPVLPSGAN